MSLENQLFRKQETIKPRKKADIIDLDKRKKEMREMREKNIKENYSAVFDFRENKYAQDLAESNLSREEKEDKLAILKKHNNIVLSDGIDLIKGNNLSLEDGIAAIIAIVMHDSGKFSSGDLEHHEKGIEYVDEMFMEMEKNDTKFEGVKLTDEIKQKIIWAIERHMNHPHLIRKNNGKRFPEPKSIVDKVVYDADMLANIGFKNVGFRLGMKNFSEEDEQVALENKTNAIEEAFKNVMADVVILDSVVMTPIAKRMAEKRIFDVKNIFNYLKENNIFENIPERVSEESKKPGSGEKSRVEIIKNLLNNEIEKAGMILGVDKEIIYKITI